MVLYLCLFVPSLSLVSRVFLPVSFAMRVGLLGFIVVAFLYYCPPHPSPLPRYPPPLNYSRTYLSISSFVPPSSYAHLHIVLSPISSSPFSGKGRFILCCWRSAVVCRLFCTTFDDSSDVGDDPPYPICSFVSRRHVSSVVMTKTCDSFDHAVASGRCMRNEDSLKTPA